MITVFTPAYNRKELLPRLYESLKRQGTEDFEWLIVDDGSTDGTEDTVRPWLKDAPFPVRCFRKENGGKHTAFNEGVRLARGEWFFCVDSDDFLPAGALKRIEAAEAYCRAPDVAGLMALKQDTDGQDLGQRFPDGLRYETAYRVSELYGCRGERTLIYRTSVLRSFPFPEIPGETFCTECVVYDRIDQRYRMYLLNEVLTVCEYQPDGLTGSIFSTMLKNPVGYKIYYAQRIDMALSSRERWGYLLRYCAFDHMSREHAHDYNGPHRAAAALARLPGRLLVRYYRLKLRKSQMN